MMYGYVNREAYGGYSVTYCNVTDVNKLSNLSDSDFITLTIAGEQQQIASVLVDKLVSFKIRHGYIAVLNIKEDADVIRDKKIDQILHDSLRNHIQKKF